MQRWIDEQARFSRHDRRCRRFGLPPSRWFISTGSGGHFADGTAGDRLSGSAYYEQIQFKRKNLTLLASAQQAIAEGQSRQALVTVSKAGARNARRSATRQSAKSSGNWRDQQRRKPNEPGQPSQSSARTVRGSENQRAVRDDLAPLYDRALIAEWAHEVLRRAYQAHSAIYDDKGTWMVRWQRPGRLSLSSQSGAKVTVQRYVIDAKGKWFVTENTELGTTAPVNTYSAQGATSSRSLAGQRDSSANRRWP